MYKLKNCGRKTIVLHGNNYFILNQKKYINYAERISSCSICTRLLKTINVIACIKNSNLKNNIAR